MGSQEKIMFFFLLSHGMSRGVSFFFILKAKIADAQEEGVAKFFLETVRNKTSIIKTWESVDLINLYNRGDCIGIVRENFEFFILISKIDDAQEEGLRSFSWEQ